MNSIFSRYRLGAFFLVFSIVVFVSDHTFAQTNSFEGGLRNAENAIFIITEPANPIPGQSFHLTAESPLMNLSADEISWVIGGKVVTRGTGALESDAAIDAKGSPLSITITVTDATWGEVSKTITITPLELDLLYDAPTYTPPFYRGRAVPSTGSTVRLQALARFPARGGFMPSSEIYYTWSKNGRVLGSASGLGKSTATLEAPVLYGRDTINVKATANDDTLSANSSVTITSRDPLIALYQVHPLYGIMYYKQIPSSSEVPDREMTFAAIPYFANTPSTEKSSLEYAWTVNGAPVAASSSNRSMITIRAMSSGSVADISLNLSDSSNIFMQSKNAWAITFGGGSGVAPGSKDDVFHSNQ